ncbi:BTB/POZ domain-containing protein [Orchesella cincta]|uniref:BTB/POZ domain-containing protein n=1 Tax=Orchesella cincta TaxID=48709 RepID=A0A1D2M9W2_ORCCI|nr:BTB/POZ domain-containing protein [Orchesella cincta]
MYTVLTLRMEVYLLKSKPFETNLFLEGVGNHGDIGAIVDFDVDLKPIPGSKASRDFCDDIKKAVPVPTAKLKMDGFRENVLFVRLKFQPVGGIYGVHGAYPALWVDAGLGPMIMKLQAAGPYLMELVNRFSEPVLMKVSLTLGENSEIQVASREMAVGCWNDATGRHYNFEEQWRLVSDNNVIRMHLHPSAYRGVMTISLIRVPSEFSIRKFLGPLPEAQTLTKKLLEDKIHCDFVIIAENGAAVPCHKSFLASHSKVFERMLQTDCKETREKAYKLRLTEGAVNALLKFLYYSNLNDPINSCSIALELLKVAHEYDIESLEKVMKRMFLVAESSILWFDVDVMLLLFQHSMRAEGYEDLKMKAVQVMKLKQHELHSSDLCQQLFKDDPEFARELFLHCLK